jgi:hypothetical protein
MPTSRRVFIKGRGRESSRFARASRMALMALTTMRAGQRGRVTSRLWAA